MFTDRKNSEEKRLSGIPHLIEELNLQCNKGKTITSIIPIIKFSLEENFHCLTDNLVAHCFGGLLANKRVSETLREVGANNIQQFPVLLKGVNGGEDCSYIIDLV